jgi:hypothetical protein
MVPMEATGSAPSKMAVREFAAKTFRISLGRVRVGRTNETTLWIETGMNGMRGVAHEKGTPCPEGWG